MKDTRELRNKMLSIWKQVDTGKLTAQEARVHIGLARTILDTLKVEIAAAHLGVGTIDPVAIGHQEYRRSVLKDN